MNCNTNCKQQGYILKWIPRKILAEIYKIQKERLQLVTVKDLKENLNLTGRQIYYNVSKLIKKGFIRNEDNSILLLSLEPKGEEYLKSILGNLQKNVSYVNSFLDRAHKITINQPIIQRGNNPEGFNISNKSNKLHWKYPQLIKKEADYTIRITPSTVSYHFSKCYGVNPHHIVNNCLNVCFRLAQALTEEGWKLDKPNEAIVEQHHAIFNKDMAKFTSPYQIYYKSNRLTFDMSISSGEFELIHPDHSPDDFLRLTDLFEAVIRGEVGLNDLKELCTLKHQIKEALLQNQQSKVNNVTENVY